jgi:bifunctional UDP-N-acetylglucosamine pyrophosphorylase/glucosamine-1-phosphate N-acetyltransferase
MNRDGSGAGTGGDAGMGKPGHRFVIVLAAGESKRMKSSTTKVLHRIAGKPVLGHTLDAVAAFGADQAVVVVGRQAERVRSAFEDYPVSFVVQEPQLGTGHAAYVGLEKLTGDRGSVLVLCGDVPLIRPETLDDLHRTHLDRAAAVTVLAVEMNDPTGYGRIIRNEDESVRKIVEEKEANEGERNVREVNTGIICYDLEYMREVLGELMGQEREGEYYLTDTIEMAKRDGRPVHATLVRDPQEVLGINDRIDLAAAEEVLRGRVRAGHMKRGVTVINPSTVIIDSGVSIGEDTVVHQCTVLEGASRIGKECFIGPFSRIIDSDLADGVELEGWNYLKDIALPERFRMNAHEKKVEEKN